MPWSDLSDGRTRAVCRSVLAGELIFVGEALIGEPIGVVETENGTGWRAMPMSSLDTSIRIGTGSAPVRCARSPAQQPQHPRC